MSRLSALLILALATLLTGCEKYALDRQMEELCAKDGGIKVYEKVVLPKEMFDERGDPFPGWRQRPESERLGKDYQLTWNVTYLKEGDPLKGEGQLSRYHRKITRKSDKKLLGEAVSYGRSGGDFIVLDHFTSRTCPETLGAPTSLIRKVFTQGEDNHAND